jgi:hypothetical protein
MFKALMRYQIKIESTMKKLLENNKILYFNFAFEEGRILYLYISTPIWTLD